MRPCVHGSLFVESMMHPENLGNGDCSLLEMATRREGPRGYQCLGAICASAIPRCFGDGDCPTGTQCDLLEQRCVPLPVSCSDDTDCDRHHQCSDGTCVRSVDAPPPALTSPRCPSGMKTKFDVACDDILSLCDLPNQSIFPQRPGGTEPGSGGGFFPNRGPLCTSDPPVIGDFIFSCVLSVRKDDPVTETLRCIAEASGVCDTPFERMNKALAWVELAGLSGGRGCGRPPGSTYSASNGTPSEGEIREWLICALNSPGGSCSSCNTCQPVHTAGSADALNWRSRSTEISNSIGEPRNDAAFLSAVRAVYLDTPAKRLLLPESVLRVVYNTGKANALLAWRHTTVFARANPRGNVYEQALWDPRTGLPRRAAYVPPGHPAAGRSLVGRIIINLTIYNANELAGRPRLNVIAGSHEFGHALIEMMRRDARSRGVFRDTDINRQNELEEVLLERLKLGPKHRDCAPDDPHCDSGDCTAEAAQAAALAECARGTPTLPPPGDIDPENPADPAWAQCFVDLSSALAEGQRGCKGFDCPDDTVCDASTGQPLCLPTLSALVPGGLEAPCAQYTDCGEGEGPPTFEGTGCLCGSQLLPVEPGALITPLGP
jgi:hypothetical protein